MLVIEGRKMSFIKKHGLIILAFSVLIAACGILLTSCVPKDYNYNDAIAIAKKDFSCEKILWINDRTAGLSNEPENELIEIASSNHYLYFVVGEIDGEEIYIWVPSDPSLNKPFVTTWALDYSFSQIVDKFNECGAQYVADVPNDYYSQSFSSYIDIFADEDYISNLAEYYAVGVDGGMFYKRLDVKAVFYYQWIDDENLYRCIVVQENGELNAYKRTDKLS